MLSITTLKVNLVESSGSLTPEELGQKQGMSVVLARYFSLICPVKQNFLLKILDVCKYFPYQFINILDINTFLGGLNIFIN